MQSSKCCTTLDVTFSVVSIEDKPWIDRIIKLEDARSCDWCFSNIFNWAECNDVDCERKVAQMGDRLGLMLSCEGERFFCFPIGQGDLVPAISIFHQIARTYDERLKLRGLTVKHRDELEQAFPGQFDFILEENIFDYVYEAEKLATLAGKKLHAKRNHINRFVGNHPNWQFEPLTKQLIPECMEMSRAWLETHQGDFSREGVALQKTFQYFDEMQLEGGVLRVDGRVIAFTIGEPLNSDTYIVHFEKAFSDIQGAYAMINREFIRHVLKQYPHIQYVNREEDLGIESLRRSKRSYYPAFLIEKYIAIEREVCV